MIEAVAVASGPSPAGRGWGAAIDAADFVVRLADWHWQDAADYGTRVDAALITTAPNYVNRVGELGWRRPPVWWGFDVQGHWADRPDDQPFLGVPVERFDLADLTAAAKAAGFAGLRNGRFDLTRGTAAAVWLALSRRPARVVLVGLDGVLAGEFGPEATRYAPGADLAFLRPGETNPRPPDDGRRTPTHDAAGDRWVLERVSEATGVAFVAAAEAWR